MTKLYAPSNNPVTQAWGAEFYNFNGRHYPQGFYRQSLGWYGHNGIDYSFGPDNNAYAAGDGVVTWADWGNKHPWISEGGIVTMIDHGSFYTVYAHLNDNNMVKVGQRVRAGQVVGLIGGTGMVSGPHLHFEVIPKNPNMGNGWYGRSKPVLASSKPATVSAASGATIKPIKTPADPLEEIMAYYKNKQEFREDLAGLIKKYTVRATFRDMFDKRDTNVAQALRAIEKITRETREIAEASAKKAGLTTAEIAAAAERGAAKGAAEALADGVDIDVTINGKEIK